MGSKVPTPCPYPDKDVKIKVTRPTPSLPPKGNQNA